jgi:hypothetical protein
MNVWVHRRMVVIVLGVAFGLALVFALSRASSAASPNGEDPEPVVFSNIEKNLCDFRVLIEGEGKIKDIEKPDGSIISTGPGVTITMTNLEEPDNQITVSDTAAWHFTAGFSERDPHRMMHMRGLLKGSVRLAEVASSCERVSIYATRCHTPGQWGNLVCGNGPVFSSF